MKLNFNPENPETHENVLLWFFDGTVARSVRVGAMLHDSRFHIRGWNTFGPAAPMGPCSPVRPMLPCSNK